MRSLSASSAAGVPMWRVALAVVVSLAVFVASPLATWASHQFSDVPDDHPFHDEIAWLADNGITTGFQDGTFRPGDDVTRMAMSAFMMRLAGHDPDVAAVVNAAQLGGVDASEYLTGVTGPDLAEIIRETETSGSVAAGTRVVQTVSCPAGTTLLSGGFFSTTVGRWGMEENRRVTADTWQVVAFNDTGGNSSIRAEAYCLAS